MNFHICSTGDPDEDYNDWNYEETRQHKVYRMHKNTKQTGSYFQIKPGDIIILKHKNILVAYGKVKRQREIAEDWGYITDVEEFSYYNTSDFEKGVSNYGVSNAVIEGGKYGTVKTIKPSYALAKLKEINSSCSLYNQIINEISMQKYIDLLKENKNI